MQEITGISAVWLPCYGSVLNRDERCGETHYPFEGNVRVLGYVRDILTK